MIQLFDVQDKKVVPSAVTYLLPELSILLTEFPDDYLKVLAYVFFTTCPDGTNAYVNLDEDTKEDVIIADLRPINFDLHHHLIEAAQDKCKELYSTPVLRAFMGAKKMLDKIATFLDNEPITTGKEGNSTEIRGMMKEMSQYWENYSKLENVLKEEQAKVRGGNKLRYDQRPEYKNTKED